VDDAIVVVENVERHLAMGKSPRDAARAAMTEVTGPVIAIALVLCAVFVPTAFMAGISGGTNPEANVFPATARPNAGLHPVLRMFDLVSTGRSDSLLLGLIGTG
jgi:hypothetical protein